MSPISTRPSCLRIQSGRGVRIKMINTIEIEHIHRLLLISHICTTTLIFINLLEIFLLKNIHIITRTNLITLILLLSPPTTSSSTAILFIFWCTSLHIILFYCFQIVLQPLNYLLLSISFILSIWRYRVFSSVSFAEVGGFDP